MIIHFIDFPFSCILVRCSHITKIYMLTIQYIDRYFRIYTKHEHGKWHEKQKFQITDERRQITSHSKLWQHKLYRTLQRVVVLCGVCVWAGLVLRASSRSEWMRVRRIYSVCAGGKRVCVHDAWKVEIKQSNDSNNNRIAAASGALATTLRQRQISGYIA